MGEPESQDLKHVFGDLESEYANNVGFESTVWDLKLIFGEYSDRNKAVEWHTSITIPWAQAKLLHYYLGVNIKAFEAEHGPLHVPESMVPPELPPVPSNATPLQQRIHEMVRVNREEFIKGLS